eukprot:GHUV01008451.1.p1 GENE.GHUV01008451.1~~GHUV01008451.1.p1  ORF type:complete len:215 (+),score=64.19 GHUV01008451.1:196-840(+)
MLQLQRCSHQCLQRSALVGRVQKTRCQPVCAKQKSKQAGVKVNKRGKVSSRPGPGSRAAEEAQQLLQESQGVSPAEVSMPAAEQQPSLQQSHTSQAAATPVSQRASMQPARQETPQVVVDRMFKRVLTFAGLPVFAGLVLFPVFWYLRVVQKIEYPLWVVYVTQAMMFGGGLLGITYGILSTSWDPKREGSALGWTELQANLPILLNRNKDQQQ